MVLVFKQILCCKKHNAPPTKALIARTDKYGVDINKETMSRRNVQQSSCRVNLTTSGQGKWQSSVLEDEKAPVLFTIVADGNEHEDEEYRVSPLKADSDYRVVLFLDTCFMSLLARGVIYLDHAVVYWHYGLVARYYVLYIHDLAPDDWMTTKWL